MNHLNKAFSMDNLITPTTGFAAMIGAIAGTFLEVLYGNGRGAYLMLLILLIFGDWITGIAAAKKYGVYSSDYGKTVGTLRTMFMLLFPAIGNWFDLAFGTPGVIFYLFTSGLIYHTWESMTANAYRAGWEKMIPKRVIKFVMSEIKAKNARMTKMKGGS